jgi:DNA-binding NarL/FixJ family response regulator
MSDDPHPAPPTPPDGTGRRVVVVLADRARASTVADALERAGDTVAVLRAPGSGDDTTAVLEHVATALPDVAVVGTDLGHRLLPLVTVIADRVPVVPLLVLAGPRDTEIVDRALLAGVRAVAPTHGADADIVSAVERTARGESPLTATAAAGVLAAYRHLTEHPETLPVAPPALTPTELEVLQRLAAGATPDQIATLHQVTPRMVLRPAAAAVGRLQRAQRDARAGRR